MNQSSLLLMALLLLTVTAAVDKAAMVEDYLMAWMRKCHLPGLNGAIIRSRDRLDPKG